jgi:hypothetical protein
MSSDLTICAKCRHCFDEWTVATRQWPTLLQYRQNLCERSQWPCYASELTPASFDVVTGSTIPATYRRCIDVNTDGHCPLYEALPEVEEVVQECVFCIIPKPEASVDTPEEIRPWWKWWGTKR